ncbi:MAG: VWA-like domain-containing protein [Thaumarchaeota archaeon]|nr:VWA-like domain-containing protein [Candidatus Calditenuaceae archaeon]
MEKKKLDTLMAAISTASPFLGSILRGARIVKADGGPWPAATDGRRTIYLYPKFFELAPAEQAAVLLHEVLHLAFRHHNRRRENSYLWNIATDSVINTMLKEEGFALPEGAITTDVVSEIIRRHPAEVKRMSAEEIYSLLLRHAPDVKLEACGLHVEEEGGGDGDKQDQSIPQDQDSKSSEDRDDDEHWHGVLNRAVVLARLAGRSKESIERAFDLMPPSQSWTSIFKQTLVEGLGRVVVQTWLRPSRRLPQLLPGSRKLTVPDVRFLVDTSASIDRTQLSKAITIVYSVTRKINSRIFLYFWDVDCYPIGIVKKTDIITKVKIKGGGGTLIAKALKQVAKDIRAGDIVIIITDGYIGDLNQDEVQRMFSIIQMKSSTAVILTSAADIRIRGWRTIKI